jgi:hypothetical protein
MSKIDDLEQTNTPCGHKFNATKTEVVSVNGLSSRKPWTNMI